MLTEFCEDFPLLGSSQEDPPLGGHEIKYQHISLGLCLRQTLMGNLEESTSQIALAFILDKNFLSSTILCLTPVQTGKSRWKRSKCSSERQQIMGALPYLSIPKSLLLFKE